MTEFSNDSSLPLPYRSCVGIVLFNKSGCVFVAQRRDLNKPSWQFPQGGINTGERPESAAFRELEEETGIKSVEIIDQIPRWLTYDYPNHLGSHSFSNMYRGQKQLWFAMQFLGADTEVNLGGWGSEFDDWKWVELNSTTSMIVDFKKGVYTEVVNYFDYLSNQFNG